MAVFVEAARGRLRLEELMPGESARVAAVGGPFASLYAGLGFLPGAEVRPLLISAGGSLCAYSVGSAVIALRRGVGTPGKRRA